jgi:hypothetical protein
MRYWAYLAGKLVTAAALLYGLFLLLAGKFPPPPHINGLSALENVGPDLVRSLVFLVWFLLCGGALYAIVGDQRRRCRVCARRLRMPVQIGSWGSILQLGRPRIESICPYGHGTLREEGLQISGLAAPQWKRNSDDIWDELCTPGKDTGQES